MFEIAYTYTVSKSTELGMTKAKQNKRASRQALSREKILKKAVSLADKHGVDALSMRKLAHALNVEAMSLYNHIDNKEDLFDSLVDWVVSQFQLPDENKHWKESLRRSVISSHDVLLKHPWATLLLLSRINTGDSIMAYSNACFGSLLNAGFSHALTDHGWNALNNHLYGFTLTEINLPINPDDYSKAAEEYLPMVPVERYPHIHSMMQIIIKGEHSGVNDFNFGLDLILNGLEGILAENH